MLNVSHTVHLNLVYFEQCMQCKPLSTLRIRYRLTLCRWLCVPNATPKGIGHHQGHMLGCIYGELGSTGRVFYALRSAADWQLAN